MPLTQIALLGRDCYLHHYIGIRGAMSMEIDTKIKEALEKRAYGFEVEEKEFIKNKNNENTGRIKVTKKYIPPDVTALRTILQLKQAGK